MTTKINLLVISATLVICGLIFSCNKDDVDPDIPVESIVLDATELTITVDETKKINFNILPENATSKTVTWNSENIGIATVNNDGEVTGVAAGEATITATVGNKTATCNITVTEKFIAVESISLNEQEVSTKDNIQLIASILPENASNKTMSWSSSNEEVATVDQNGNVTTVSVGETTITVTTEDGEKQAFCKVIVEPTSVTEITLEVEELLLGLEESITIQATVEPENATNKNVIWSSDDESVATVDNEGKVTTMAVGEANITATTEDGGIKATCKVTVSAAVFRDDFNRNDTGQQGPDNPNGIGTNWTIINGLHEIKEHRLESRVGTGLNQAVIFYTKENAITKNVGGNFSVSTDVNHGAWAGLIFNANENADSYSYYLFRVHSVNNSFQFLATENNGTGWTVLATTAVQEADFPDYETYRLTIQSVEVGKFTATITDSSGTKIGEYILTDDKNKNYQNGFAGYWSQLDPKFDNFLLEVR